MRCRDCAGTIEIERTVHATDFSKTSEAVCSECGEKWTLVSFVSHKSKPNGKGSNGSGAHATAKKIAQGKLVPDLRKNSNAS